MSAGSAANTGNASTRIGVGGGQDSKDPGHAPVGAAATPSAGYGVSWGAEQHPPHQVVVREKARALKLTKYKGLDDTMSVTMWLKTVRAELAGERVPRGMSSSDGATHVRGHMPHTLDEAVHLAVPHVGEYGEGYGIGLEAAMARWNGQQTQRGHGPLAVAQPTSGQEQSGLRGNSGNVATGYGSMWGTTRKPPRYDTEGSPVSAGTLVERIAIPPVYELVPTGKQASSGDGLKIQTAGDDQSEARGKRASGEHQNRRQAKALKVEAVHGGASGTGCGRTPRWRHVRGGYATMLGDGHYARESELKRSDLAARSATGGQGGSVNSRPAEGNGPRALGPRPHSSQDLPREDCKGEARPEDAIQSVKAVRAVRGGKTAAQYVMETARWALNAREEGARGSTGDGGANFTNLGTGSEIADKKEPSTGDGAGSSGDEPQPVQTTETVEPA
ncbi:unnamed protein product [Phytophthora fragariaefolia]|uniref:Unnamed protein product n=1 Tax=Phytophthora fragariaefolia TaxID=1490495 RepID=A0A9W6XXR7_9STRA|nr:unnamed protein product [Phytophthora fragariaefolia]